MLVGALALLLRWLTYPQALSCAAGLVAFNVLLLPRLPGSKRFLYRADERERGYSAGILLYPVSVFLLILLFPLPVAASMWGMLSVGDGMATLVGSRVGKRPLPWNPGKTLEGLLGFMAGSAPAAAFLFWWTVPNAGSSPAWWSSLLDVFQSLNVTGILFITMIASVVSAFIETFKLPVDDNITAPLGGACVMTGMLYALG